MVAGRIGNAPTEAIRSARLGTMVYLIWQAGMRIHISLPSLYLGFALGEAAAVSGSGMVKLFLDAGAEPNMRLKKDSQHMALAIKVLNVKFESVKNLSWDKGRRGHASGISL
jgi:hypothetical protein